MEYLGIDVRLISRHEKFISSVWLCRLHLGSVLTHLICEQQLLKLVIFVNTAASLRSQQRRLLGLLFQRIQTIYECQLWQLDAVHITQILPTKTHNILQLISRQQQCNEQHRFYSNVCRCRYNVSTRFSYDTFTIKHILDQESDQPC